MKSVLSFKQFVVFALIGGVVWLVWDWLLCAMNQTCSGTLLTWVQTLVAGAIVTAIILTIGILLIKNMRWVR